MRRKKRLWRKVRVGIKTEIYRDVEKSVKNLIRRAKSSIEKKLAAYDRGNKRQFYATINREQRADQQSDLLRPRMTQESQTWWKWRTC